MFYFAWVPDGNTTFGPIYAVEDEEVFSFEIVHNEGEFASLAVTLVNPRVGLLNDSRSQWCWFSWRRPDDVLVPLFHGRLVGIPADMSTTTVTLNFVARPEDFDSQKSALAESLKVYPYWDPIWIADDQLADPDVVLSARPALWHIGRIDKTVTISDILNGEDGTITYDDTQTMANTLQFSYGTTISQVHVVATVSWDQSGFGTVDVTDQLLEAFQKEGSKKYYATTYTGQGLEATWPVPGTDIGGGWSVFESSSNLKNKNLTESDYLSVPIDPAKATPDFTIESWWATSPEGYDYWYNKAYNEWLAEQMTKPREEARFYEWRFQPRLVVQYQGTRGRSEVLSFDVHADIQPLLYEDEPTVTEVTIESNSLSEPIDPDGAVPIGDLSRNTFFDTERADQAISYLLSMVRSQILFAARAINITADVPFPAAVNLSCRHNVLLALDDLPGGQALGKVTSYTLSLDGNDGNALAHVTIGCTVGSGNSLAPPDEGTATYVIDDVYVEDRYQVYIGGELSPIAGEITYTKPSYEPTDDNLDLENMSPDEAIAATSSQGVLELDAPGADGNTITIGTRTYTLVDGSLPLEVDQILIGPDESITARNISSTINHDEVYAGIVYDINTVANVDVYAAYASGFVRVSAWVPGPAGNSIPLASVGADLFWDASTMRYGDDGLVVINGIDAQEEALDHTVGSVDEAIDQMNAVATVVNLALTPITGGPFETDITLVVSDLMVPKTIDLEAVATAARAA